ncbi:MAG: hypothetical protein M3158_02995, partial [Pseudomonadota bacterium]|nr:hypothetical protein [Pseudomonadota bacterium]
PPAAGNATANPAMASAAQADPASTGAIAASRRASDVIPVPGSLPSEALLSKTAAPAEPDASAARSRSTWKNGVCKILFFGILPGC